MRKRVTFFLLLGLITVPGWGQYDTYGGWLKLKGRKTGFFHTEQIGGRWWLVTPEGNVFFSKGVGSIDVGRRDSSPEEQKKLAAERAQQLKEWNFNTAARRPLSGMAYSLNLGLAASTQADMWLKGLVPDFFCPEFREGAERRAAERCPALADDPWLIGYFTDNEIRWNPNRRSPEDVLDSYLKLPPASPGYQRAVAFLEGRGHKPDSVTEEDRSDFLEIAAAEYARVCHEAIRRHDPNHLILGCRIASRVPLPLIRATAPYYDVMTLNNYDHRAPLYELRMITDVTGKPTMITEFSFKAMDSGLPNTHGAGKPVATQQDRADLWAAYVQDLARLPSCVGFHWFRYRDQPREGRENCNYGLVKLDGTPWTLLTRRMTEVNAGIEALAAKSR